MATSRKGYIPKEEYDDLYYYMEDSQFNSYLRGRDPLKMTSPRRYHTIQEVRRSALAKSKKNFAIMIGFSKDMPQMVKLYSLAVHVFKGRIYLGCVQYNSLKGAEGGMHDFYDGLWFPAEHPKDPVFLLKDGSIGTKKTRRRP